MPQEWGGSEQPPPAPKLLLEIRTGSTYKIMSSRETQAHLSLPKELLLWELTQDPIPLGAVRGGSSCRDMGPWKSGPARTQGHHKDPIPRARLGGFHLEFAKFVFNPELNHPTPAGSEAVSWFVFKSLPGKVGTLILALWDSRDMGTRRGRDGNVEGWML